MSDTVIEIVGQIVVQIITTLINAVFIMWFWNDGLVGAVDGVHAVGYVQALVIYSLVYCFFQPLVKLSKEK
jgi:hypothetical protein